MSLLKRPIFFRFLLKYKKFLKRIDSYIVRHFKKLKKSNDRRRELILKGRLHIYYVPKERLEERLRWLKQNFPQYLINFIAQRDLNEVDVYKKAHLDRRMLSKLRNERDYMPSERTLWAIALAMELNLDEALEILHKAGFTLSTHSKEDLIIKFFFENKIYDMFLLNETLDHYGFKPLGG